MSKVQNRTSTELKESNMNMAIENGMLYDVLLGFDSNKHVLKKEQIVLNYERRTHIKTLMLFDSPIKLFIREQWTTTNIL